MKCDPATLAELCSRPGAKSLGVKPAKTETRPVKRNKYKNVRTEYNGVMYQSKAEAARAKWLDREQAAGAVRFWVGQPKFRLGVPENVFVADFLVVPEEGRGCVRVEDVKGVETAKFRRDKKLWQSYGPCPLAIVRGGCIQEVIVPRGKEENVA